MNPGVDDARTGVLPHASAVAYRVSTVDGAVARPETISTSGISGAGLKKCMPDDAARTLHPGGERGDRERRRVGREDAFVAHDVLDAAEELALRGEVFDDRLDDELRDADVGQRDHGRDPPDRGIDIALAEPALGRLPAERFGDAALRRVAGADARVVQLHAMAVQRGDLRDARAHRAGADHGDGGARRQCGGHARRAAGQCISAPARPSEAH